MRDEAQRRSDLDLLERAVGHLVDTLPTTHDAVGCCAEPCSATCTQLRAFSDMRETLRRKVPGRCAHAVAYEQWSLTDRQRKWVRVALERFEPQYENLVSAGAVPHGREVPTIEALRPENLPKRPPGRKS